MDWLLRPDTVSKSIRAAVLAQVATLLVCYMIWVWEGCDHFMPFIRQPVDRGLTPIQRHPPWIFGYCRSNFSNPVNRTKNMRLGHL